MIQPQESNINHAQWPLHNKSEICNLQWMPSCMYGNVLYVIPALS